MREMFLLSERVKKIMSRPFMASVIFFIVVFCVFVTIFLVSNGDPVPDDEYFHFKYAYLLRSEGWNVVKHFDWIYLSQHGTDGGARYAVNLYQISLIPFTYFPDQLMGLYVAIAFYLSGVIAIVYYVLRKERIKNPLFFALLLVTSSYLMSRMLLGRAFVLILGIVFLEMYFAIHRKYLPLCIVVIVHVLWHQTTYFLPLIIVSMVEISRYLLQQKMEMRTIATSVGAVVGAMAFFPGFPVSLFSWMQGIFAMQKNDPTATSGSLGGAEMATKDFMTYFAGQEMILLALFFCVFSVIFFYVMQKKNALSDPIVKSNHMHWVYCLFFFALFVVFGSVVVSGRFFDFVLPVTILFLAFVVNVIGELKMIVIDVRYVRWVKGIIYVWVFVVCINVLLSVYAQSNAFDYMPARSAAQWIDAHSDGRDKVFVHNWGNFTLMFFGNAHNVYSTGIEPTTLKKYNESLYWKYYNMIAHNYYCESQKDCKDAVDSITYQLSKKDAKYRDAFIRENGKKILQSIKNDFGAKFIVSDSQEFDEVLFSNPELIADSYTVTSDKYTGKHMQFTVFKLK